MDSWGTGRSGYFFNGVVGIIWCTARAYGIARGLFCCVDFVSNIVSKSIELAVKTRKLQKNCK